MTEGNRCHIEAALNEITEGYCRELDTVGVLRCDNDACKHWLECRIPKQNSAKAREEIRKREGGL